MANLTGKTALITGAGRGIGRAIALDLAAAGATVAIASRTISELEAVAAECAGNARVIQADMGDPDATRQLALQATEALGHIDILVCAAGVSAAEPLHRAELATLQKMLAINTIAPWILMRELTPGMRERKWGRVIGIASVAGLRGYPYISAYATSKHALVGMVRSAAQELAKFGVTVNAICPGYVDSAMTQASIQAIAAKTGRGEADARASLEAFSPQIRLFTPEEVASLALWLCGDGARGVNGQALSICGGELA